MSPIRRSARLAAKKGNVSSTVKQETVPLTVRVTKPKVKNIDIADQVDLKSMPKLLDDFDDERTISTPVTPVVPAVATKPAVPAVPVKPAKPVEVKKEQSKDTCDYKNREALKKTFMNEFPMPEVQAVKPVEVKKESVAEAPNNVDLIFYIFDNMPTLSSYVSTSDLKGKECVICKRTTTINMIKDYLELIDNSIGNFKVSLIMDLFEFIDKNFDYINTQEFDPSKKFVITIHTKTLSMREELNDKIKETNPQYTNDIAMYNRAKELLGRVHTKCHLYGMDKFVTSDPVYKKFLATYMEQFLEKQ
jgi:hypothetical protein